MAPTSPRRPPRSRRPRRPSATASLALIFLPFVAILPRSSAHSSSPSAFPSSSSSPGSSPTSSSTIAGRRRGILVAGSVNADTLLRVPRLPVPGENVCAFPSRSNDVDVPGGKGCTQAVASSKLLPSPSSSGGGRGGGGVAFLGRFGSDAVAETLRSSLTDRGIDVSHSKTIVGTPSGRGYVFVDDGGQVSAVVSGGSNFAGWDDWRVDPPSKEYFDGLFNGKFCLLLQREIPEFVNELLAKEAKRRGVIVMQDVGGEDRRMTSEAMSNCDYLIPNETELMRLVKSCLEEEGSSSAPSDPVECAKILQRRGANHVLTTLGSKGSVLVTKNGTIVRCDACDLPEGSRVIDETGAGDCYRAAFAIASSEGKSWKQCMEFGSASGALSVTRDGAVPSAPEREEVERLREACFGSSPEEEEGEKDGGGGPSTSIPRGGGEGGASSSGGAEEDDDDDSFPYLFGSRLNSMKDRPDLWPSPVDDVREWVKRQGTVSGLGCVDFNYPQHFQTWTTSEAKTALEEAGLIAGAVCLRYPSEFARGAMNHPDPIKRRAAIELTKRAAEVAIELGCDEVVIWSAYDGYDYPFQVNYDEKWKEIVDAFRELCDAYPAIKFSIEFKPTDENTRFFTVPSTGAALLLVKEIDRPNVGLTLDVGHMLMAGENPGQSIAMAGDKVFGVQLNDGYTRLAAEDGMMFGSVHPSMALEVCYQLQRVGFRGHLYFDTFPQRTDPVKEAEYNIRRVKAFWRAASKLDGMGLRRITDEHDAIGALELVNEALRNT